MALLAKLASHCPLRDGTAEQAKHRALDFLDDLAPFTVAEIDNACADYRRNPKNKFFPNPGGLLELLAAARKHRAELDRIKPARTPWGDSRPNMWWWQPKARWKSHWSEDEIPAQYREQYDIIKAKQAGGEAA